MVQALDSRTATDAPFLLELGAVLEKSGAIFVVLVRRKWDSRLRQRGRDMRRGKEARFQHQSQGRKISRKVGEKGSVDTAIASRRVQISVFRISTFSSVQLHFLLASPLFFLVSIEILDFGICSGVYGNSAVEWTSSNENE